MFVSTLLSNDKKHFFTRNQYVYSAWIVYINEGKSKLEVSKTFFFKLWFNHLKQKRIYRIFPSISCKINQCKDYSEINKKYTISYLCETIWTVYYIRIIFYICCKIILEIKWKMLWFHLNFLNRQSLKLFTNKYLLTGGGFYCVNLCWKQCNKHIRTNEAQFWKI